MVRTGVQVRIASGPQAGEVFWITKRLTRLGSAGGCDIPLRDAAAAPHAVSIEKSDDRILVHNRSEKPIELDAASVPPGGVLAWRDGATLRVTPHSELVLDCQAPIEDRRAAIAVDDPDEDRRERKAEEAPNVAEARRAPSQDASAKAAAGSNLFPLIFIAGCLALIAYLIYYKVSGGAQPSMAAAQLSWEEVWASPDLLQKGDPPLRTQLQLLYRYQGLGESIQFERLQGETLRALDRELKPTGPTAQRDEKTVEQLQQLRDFVKNLKPGAK